MEVLSARPDAVGAKIVRDKDSYVTEASFGKQLNMGAGSQWSQPRDYMFGTSSPIFQLQEGRRAGGWVQSPMANDLIHHVYVMKWWLSGKESACQCRGLERHEFHPWVGKIPWRRKQQHTPVFLPGQSHGQRSLVGYSPWDCKESDMTEQLTTQVSWPH